MSDTHGDKPGDIEMAKLTSKTALLSKVTPADPGAASGADAGAGAGAGASAGGGPKSSRKSGSKTPSRPRRGSPTPSSSSSASSTPAPSSSGMPAGALAGVLVLAGVVLAVWLIRKFVFPAQAPAGPVVPDYIRLDPSRLAGTWKNQEGNEYVIEGNTVRQKNTEAEIGVLDFQGKSPNERFFRVVLRGPEKAKRRASFDETKQKNDVNSISWTFEKDAVGMLIDDGHLHDIWIHVDRAQAAQEKMRTGLDGTWLAEISWSVAEVVREQGQQVWQEDTSKSPITLIADGPRFEREDGSAEKWTWDGFVEHPNPRMAWKTPAGHDTRKWWKALETPIDTEELKGDWWVKSAKDGEWSKCDEAKCHGAVSKAAGSDSATWRHADVAWTASSVTELRRVDISLARRITWTSEGKDKMLWQDKVPWKEAGRWYLNGFGPATDRSDRLLTPAAAGGKKAFHYSVFVTNFQHIAHQFELLGGAGTLFDVPAYLPPWASSLLRGDNAFVAKVTGGSKGVDLRGLASQPKSGQGDLRRYIRLQEGVRFSDPFIKEAILHKYGVDVFTHDMQYGVDVITHDMPDRTMHLKTAEGASGTFMAYKKEYKMALMYTYKVMFEEKSVFTVEPAGDESNSYDVILEDVMAARVTKVLRKTGAGQTEEETLHVEGVSRAIPAKMSMSQMAGTWWTHLGSKDELRHSLVEVAEDGSVKTGKPQESRKIVLDEDGFAKLDGLQGRFGQNADEITWWDPKGDPNDEKLQPKEWWTRQDAKVEPKWTCDITALTEAKPKIECHGPTWTEIPNLAVTMDTGRGRLDIMEKNAQQNPGPGPPDVYVTGFKSPKNVWDAREVRDSVARPGGKCPALAIRYKDGKTPVYLSTEKGPVKYEDNVMMCKNEPSFKTMGNTKTTVRIWFTAVNVDDKILRVKILVQVFEKATNTATRTIDVTMDETDPERAQVEYMLGETQKVQPDEEKPVLLFDFGN